MSAQRPSRWLRLLEAMAWSGTVWSAATAPVRPSAMSACETCDGERMGIDANPLSLTFGEVVTCPDCFESGWVRATRNQLTLWWLWLRGYCDRRWEDGGARYTINAKGRARLAEREARR